jgi:hypothetical protein
MPNLGAGVDQHVNVTATPTWVFSPNPSAASSSLRLYNEGSQPVYVGGANVTPLNGLLIPPGSRPLELQNVNSTVYTCSNAVAGASTQAATLGTGTGIATVGTTKLTVTTMSAAFSAGAILQLGTSTNIEYVVVASTATTVVTLSNPTIYYHAVGDVMTVATSTIAQLRVTAGA